MAITKNDCMLLLAEMQKNGYDTKEMTLKAATSQKVNMEVVKFINDNRPFEVRSFYEKLRSSYNNKKSQLYINIVKVDEQEPKDILTTIASLNLQILLFAKGCKERELFLRNARLDEITASMYNYSKTFDLVPCIKVLTAVKADLKAFEMLNTQG